MPGLTDLLDATPRPSTIDRGPLGSLDDDPVSRRVRRLTNRFEYAWNHPKWRRWREQSKEDFEFHTGTGQWDEAIKNELQRQKRPALTFNRIRRAIAVITGYERTARMDLKYVPQSSQFLKEIEVFNRLAKRAQNDQQSGFVLSDGFKDGVIGGLGVWYFGVDYDDDIVHGRPTILKCRPGDVLWDPDAYSYDLSDARDVFWYKMVAVDDLVAQYPESEDDILEALEQVSSRAAPGDTTVPSRDPSDGYVNVRTDGLSYYDQDRQEVLVLEAWYRVRDDVSLLLDERQNTISEIPEDAMATARQLASVDPAITIIIRPRKRVEMSVLLPAVRREIQQGNPFENDQEDYPFVPFMPYKEGDEMLGLVRNMKDPQRDYNKRRSAMIDNVLKHGAIRWWAMRNAIENPEFFESSFDAGGVAWGRPGGQKPEPLVAPELPAWVHLLDQKDKQDLDDIPGVNPALLGQYGGGQTGRSGAALARQQAQGQLMVAELFDAYRRSRMLAGKRFGKRIQQVYTAERITRLEGATAGQEFVTLNHRTIDPETGHEMVENDIPSIKWDIEVTDSPSTPTARSASLGMLFEFLKIEPQFAPALADRIFELMDNLPDKENTLERVRTIMRGLGVPIQPDGSIAPPQPGQPPAAAPGPPPGPRQGVRRPRPKNQMGPLVQALQAQQAPPPVIA